MAETQTQAEKLYDIKRRVRFNEGSDKANAELSALLLREDDCFGEMFDDSDSKCRVCRAKCEYLGEQTIVRDLCAVVTAQQREEAKEQLLGSVSEQEQPESTTTAPSSPATSPPQAAAPAQSNGASEVSEPAPAQAPARLRSDSQTAGNPYKEGTISFWCYESMKQGGTEKEIAERALAMSGGKKSAVTYTKWHISEAKKGKELFTGHKLTQAGDSYQVVPE